MQTGLGSNADAVMNAVRTSVAALVHVPEHDVDTSGCRPVDLAAAGNSPDGSCLDLRVHVCE